mmetsp:Transcript_4712/g.6350  ORF Transcript_4712/g.6350 Transcript_4712/m.6350 type:complete len:205 (-) Transcript_4712:142-756(-)
MTDISACRACSVWRAELRLPALASLRFAASSTSRTACSCFPAKVLSIISNFALVLLSSTRSCRELSCDLASAASACVAADLYWTHEPCDVFKTASSFSTDFNFIPISLRASSFRRDWEDAECNCTFISSICMSFFSTAAFDPSTTVPTSFHTRSTSSCSFCAVSVSMASMSRRLDVIASFKAAISSVSSAIRAFCSMESTKWFF